MITGRNVIIPRVVERITVGFDWRWVTRHVCAKIAPVNNILPLVNENKGIGRARRGTQNQSGGFCIIRYIKLAPIDAIGSNAAGWRSPVTIATQIKIHGDGADAGNDNSVEFYGGSVARAFINGRAFVILPQRAQHDICMRVGVKGIIAIKVHFRPRPRPIIGGVGAGIGSHIGSALAVVTRENQIVIIVISIHVPSQG